MLVCHLGLNTSRPLSVLSVYLNSKEKSRIYETPKGVVFEQVHHIDTEGRYQNSYHVMALSAMELYEGGGI